MAPQRKRTPEGGSKSSSGSHQNAAATKPTFRSENSATNTTSKLSSAGFSPALQTNRTVLYGRILFVVGLTAVAAVLGYLAYCLVRNGEEDLALTRFEAIATRALLQAQQVVAEKKLTAEALAHQAAASNPRADAWPNVHYEGFEESATSLRRVTQGQEIAFCPIVQPGGDEQIAFEVFAYDFYRTRPLPSYPDTMGMSSFGEGIFSFGEPTAVDFRYHDTTGVPRMYNSSKQILVPAFQLDQGYHPAAMLNVHFEKTRGDLIDAIIDCSQRRAETQDYTVTCASITDLMPDTQSQHADKGPGALIMEPIYPKFDNTTITGFIVSKMVWDEALHFAFASDVNGLDCVLSTDTASYTYHIVNGEAVYGGEGDLHQPNARLASKSVTLNGREGQDDNFFSNTTVVYRLQIYSTHAYIESYGTNNPWLACIGAVGIALVVSSLFFLYDWFVRREFDHKRHLLEAKRRFVRFVSHEVRTPLNTVCMGMALLKEKALADKEWHDQQQQQHDGQLGLSMDMDDETLRFSSSRRNNNSYDEEWLELCCDVEDNAQVAVGILNDLLNYDKIMMGAGLSLELDLIPVWPNIEQTTGEFQIAASKKKIALNLEYDKAMLDMHSMKLMDLEQAADGRTSSLLDEQFRNCRIIADPVRLSQVLRNLLSNGLKFTKSGGHLTVRVSVKKLERRITVASERFQKWELKNGGVCLLTKLGHVCVEVIDDGAGMSPDQVDCVFQDGTQFNANEQQAGGGTGLGLAVSRGIAEQHGGSLVCSSMGLGKGTTFTLTLPLYESPPEDTAVEESSYPDMCDASLLGLDKQGSCSSIGSIVSMALPDAESMRKVDNEQKETAVQVGEKCPPQEEPQSLRILVVDDAKMNLKLCMRLLTRQGHICDGAEDGVEACKAVKASIENGTDYDCILLDYCMPNMNGPDAAKEMRAMGSSAFIVGVTGNLMTEDVDYFRRCGANWVLAKPFKVAELNQQLVENGILGCKQEPKTFRDGQSAQSAPPQPSMVRVESGGKLEGMLENQVLGSPPPSQPSMVRVESGGYAEDTFENEIYC